MAIATGHKFRPDKMPNAMIIFEVKDDRAIGYTFESPEETNVATRLDRSKHPTRLQMTTSTDDRECGYDSS